MNQITKNILWVIIAVLVVWGVYSLTSDTTPTSSEPIRIGVLAPLTGDAAAYGEPLSEVLRIAADEINQSGGIDGRPLEMIFEDARCNGKDAANAMQKLVNVDKVQVVLGGFCSSESLAAVPIATQGKVMLFSGGSSSPDLTGISSYFARNYPSDASQGMVLADIVFTDKGWKKVAFIQEQLDYPLGIYKAFSKRFQELGGVVVKEEFPTPTTDFRSQLTKLRGESPDALFIDVQTPAVAQRIFKQLQELKWKPAFLVNDATVGDAATIKPYANLLEGALAAEFGVDSSNLKFRHILDAYKEKFGSDAPYQSYVQTMYDAIYIIADGIKAVGYDGGKIASWIYKVKDWSGASGKTTIGPDGDRVGGHIPKIIRNGEVQLYEK